MPAGSGFIAKPYDLEKVAADLRAMIGLLEAPFESEQNSNPLALRRWR
jgi:hypothetical protein